MKKIVVSMIAVLATFGLAVLSFAGSGSAGG